MSSTSGSTNGNGNGQHEEPTVNTSSPGYDRVSGIDFGSAEQLNHFYRLVTNQIESLRSQFLGGIFDPRRDIYHECGLPKTVTSALDYWFLYDRESLAKRVVELMPKECAQVTPSVFESDDPDVITPFERWFDNMGKMLRGQFSLYNDQEGNPFWKLCLDADILSGIGSYGVIYLGIDDGLDPRMPVAGLVEENSIPFGWNPVFDDRGSTAKTFESLHQAVDGPGSGPTTNEPNGNTALPTLPGGVRLPAMLPTSPTLECFKGRDRPTLFLPQLNLNDPLNPPALNAALTANAAGVPFAYPKYRLIVNGREHDGCGSRKGERAEDGEMRNVRVNNQAPFPRRPIQRGVNPGKYAKSRGGRRTVADHYPSWLIDFVISQQLGQTGYSGTQQRGYDTSFPWDVKAPYYPPNTPPLDLLGQVPPGQRAGVVGFGNVEFPSPTPPGLEGDSSHVRPLPDPNYGDARGPFDLGGGWGREGHLPPDSPANIDPLSTAWGDRTLTAEELNRDLTFVPGAVKTETELPGGGAGLNPGEVGDFRPFDYRPLIPSNSIDVTQGRPNPRLGPNGPDGRVYQPDKDEEDEQGPPFVSREDAERAAARHALSGKDYQGPGGAEPGEDYRDLGAAGRGGNENVVLDSRGYVIPEADQETFIDQFSDPDMPEDMYGDAGGYGEGGSEEELEDDYGLPDYGGEESYDDNSRYSQDELHDEQRALDEHGLPLDVEGLDSNYVPPDDFLRSDDYSPSGDDGGEGGWVEGTEDGYQSPDLDPGNDVTAPEQEPDWQPRCRLLFARVFPEHLALITRYEANPTSPRFGQPLEYLITFGDPREHHSGIGIMMATRHVHWSRVIHIADTHHMASTNPFLAIPRLKPVLNNILGLQKYYCGAPEGYWQSGVTPILSVESNPQMGPDVKVQPERIKDTMEKLRAGLQKWTLLIGLTLKTVGPQIVDPANHINTQIEAIGITLGCPIRILKGSERGEQASTQDDDNWNDRKRERIMSYNIPGIVCPVIDRFCLLGILPTPKNGYSVEVPDITSQSAQQKGQVSAQIVTLMTQYLQGGCDVLIAPKRFLTQVVGPLLHRGFDEAEADAILEEVREQLEESDALPVSGGTMVPMMQAMMQLIQAASQGGLSEDQVRGFMKVFGRLGEDEIDELIADGIQQQQQGGMGGPGEGGDGAGATGVGREGDPNALPPMHTDFGTDTSGLPEGGGSADNGLGGGDSLDTGPNDEGFEG